VKSDGALLRLRHYCPTQPAASVRPASKAWGDANLRIYRQMSPTTGWSTIERRLSARKWASGQKADAARPAGTFP
jgi:hypothetical protein